MTTWGDFGTDLIGHWVAEDGYIEKNSNNRVNFWQPKYTGYADGYQPFLEQVTDMYKPVYLAGKVTIDEAPQSRNMFGTIASDIKPDITTWMVYKLETNISAGQYIIASGYQHCIGWENAMYRISKSNNFYCENRQLGVNAISSEVNCLISSNKGVNFDVSTLYFGNTASRDNVIGSFSLYAFGAISRLITSEELSFIQSEIEAHIVPYRYNIYLEQSI